MRYSHLCMLVALCLSFVAQRPTVCAETLRERIDAAVAARAGGPVAGTASDHEWIRRVTLDLAGIIPTTEEVRSFVEDKDSAKRQKLVDRLLRECPSVAILATSREPLHIDGELRFALPPMSTSGRGSGEEGKPERDQEHRPGE